MKLYSVKDRVSGNFSQPCQMPDREEAVVRELRNFIKSPGQSPIQLYPRDHELYYIGDFDEKRGTLLLDPESPRFVLNLSDILEE